ncbi:MAG TPA: ATP-binding protein [Myxococcota bacterium]|jgi:PAS domain S-box-containing protein|nr:ATP-binding protein [Myxococcota bacterium]
MRPAAPDSGDHVKWVSEAIMQGSSDVLAILDAHGTVLWESSSATALHGYAPEEQTGVNPFARVHPDDLPRVLAYFVERLGTPGIADPVEYRYRHKSGRWLHVESVGNNLLHDPAVRGIVVSSRDITRRKEAEAALARRTEQNLALEARLQLADRLSAVGRMAAGIGHEVNNPLSYVISNQSFALDEVRALTSALAAVAADPTVGADAGARLVGLQRRLAELEAALADALGGAARVRDIVQELRSIAHVDDDPALPVDVVRVVTAALTVAGYDIRRRARLTTHLDPVPPVRAPEARLGQVFVHLLLNAAQAIPESARADGHEIAVTVRRASHATVTVEVRDTGEGIPADLRARIFDPFFTTRPIGRGLGLGLSVSHAIVTQLGGDLTAAPAPGGGSVFTVTLPVDA